MTALPQPLYALEADLKQAGEFLDWLGAWEDRFTFQTFADTPEAKTEDKAREKAGQPKKYARLFHGTLEQHAPELQRLNAAGAGVFVAVNETDLQGREIHNVQRVRAVFSDTDGAPLAPIKACSLPPSLIVESSPESWHAYWLCGSLPLDQFKGVQWRIADTFDSDSTVNDLPRVMRLPGFWHRKGEPYQVRIVSAGNGEEYSADQILATFPPMTERPKRAKTQKQPELTQHSGPAPVRPTSPQTGARKVSPLPQDERTLAALSEPVRQRLLEGVPEGSRSEAIYGTAKDLIRMGLPDDEVARILTEPAYGLSAKAYEGGRGSRAAAIQWTLDYTVRNARAEVAKEMPPMEPDTLFTPPTRDYLQLPESFRQTLLGTFAARVAHCLEFPEASVALSLLAGASAAVATRYAVQYASGTSIPTGIYVVVEQPPSMMKSRLLSFAQNPYLKGIGAHNRKIYRHNDTLDKKDPKAQPSFTVSTDPTTAGLDMTLAGCSEGRFFVASAEQAAFQSLFPEKADFATHNGLLLQGWAGEYASATRKGRAAFTGHVSGAVLVIAQPGSSARVFKASNGTGLAERFFYLSEPSPLGTREHHGEFVTRDEQQPFRSACTQCVEAYSKARFEDLAEIQDPEILEQINLTPEGYRLMLETKRQLEPELGRLARDGELLRVGWLGKIETHTLKVAAVLHVLECLGNGCKVPQQIPLHLVQTALELVQVLADHLGEILNDCGETGEAAEVDAVIELVSRKPYKVRALAQALRKRHPFRSMGREAYNRARARVEAMLDGKRLVMNPRGEVEPA